MVSKRVYVVGAWVAGLTSAKLCLEEGFESICYKKDIDTGGLWNYHEETKYGDPSIYNSCSKEMTCYSDFPIPKEFPNFMHHRHFKKYLDMYADNFQLKQYILFEHRVERIEKVDTENRWKVTTKNLKSGRIESKVFDFVMVCSGHLYEPYIPAFPGMDSFQGKLIHSHDYKSFHGFEGKRILVYISTRRGTYIRQRTADFDIPFDHLVVNRFYQDLLKDLLTPIIYHKLSFRYKHSNYKLAPNTKLIHCSQTISDDLPNRIIYGTISVMSNVKQFTENGAIFDDSSRIQNIDVVVLATGFRFSFPFLNKSMIEIDDQFAYLYKFVFPVNLQPSTLAVIGFVRPFGGLPPIIEMQARWTLAVFSNKYSLLKPTEHRRVVEKQLQSLKQTYGEDAVRKPRLRVYFIPYVDELAAFIGCKPNLLKYLLTDPKFWYKLYFGPATPPQWRLTAGKLERCSRRYPKDRKEHILSDANKKIQEWVSKMDCMMVRSD